MCTFSFNSNFGGNANPLAIQVSKRKFEVNNGAINGAYRKATGQVLNVARRDQDVHVASDRDFNTSSNSGQTSKVLHGVQVSALR